METFLSRIVLNGRSGFSTLRPYRNILFIVFGLIITAALSAYAFSPASAPDLAQRNNFQKANINGLWARGELVVLMRHVERCDHSTNPCMGDPTGITRKGQNMAIELNKSMKTLGLSNADIFSSPLLRTTQTSHFVFDRTVANQDWLINCRKTMLQDVVAHKVDQRNLILVTHSECIDQLEKSLNIPRTMMNYGASLIVSIDPNSHKPKILGFMDAPGWKTVLAKTP
jgi:phosphohistidine phosphatase SixA